MRQLTLACGSLEGWHRGPRKPGQPGTQACAKQKLATSGCASFPKFCTSVNEITHKLVLKNSLLPEPGSRFVGADGIHRNDYH